MKNILRVLALIALSAVASKPAQADVQSQLDAPAFAACLAQQGYTYDFDSIKAAHRLGNSDLLLVYLSVYSGTRAPGVDRTLQQPAYERWARAWEPQELRLAFALLGRLGRGPITPGQAFGDALTACSGAPAHDVFCPMLTLHNVLRTFGRYEQAEYHEPLTGRLVDLNPSWFKSNRDYWVNRIRELRPALAPLRRATGGESLGDPWGDWYHFFGIMTYAVHEKAVNHTLRFADFVVRLNELLNPLLVGQPEDPVKAQVDRDSLQVGWYYLNGDYRVPHRPCDDPRTYVQEATP